MPGPRSGRSARLALCAAAGFAALFGVACYRPNIAEGGFQCNLDAGMSHFCPEGFSCDMRAPPRCWKMVPEAGVPDVSVEMQPEVPPEPPTDGPANCFEARPGCDSSDAGVCDPYCKTGCSGCRDKCSVADVDGGAPLYSCVAVPATPVDELRMCDPTRDACGPGLVCMNDNCGGRCYRYCRSDNDCPGAACSRTAPGGLMACDVPNVTCVPTSASAGGQTGCPTTSQGCYISFTHPDHTLCDCTGGAGENASCTGSRSCLPGLLCVDATGSGSRACLRVCVRGDGSNCLAGQTCQQYVGSSPQNPPNPTYGFCF